jgi:hypothetical protein
MNHFDLWVCKAVANVSGIWPRAIADYSGECALTFTDCRAVACQALTDTFFNESMQAFARLSCEVTTNEKLPH